MKLHFTSGYHPEGDRETECANQTLEQYLQVYCNYQQNNWSDLLPLAEFTYNNAPNATMGLTPFYANKGYHPSITIHPEHDIASTRAWHFAVNLDDLHQQLWSHISNAQKRYSVSAEKRQTPLPDVKIGDKVFVKSNNIHTTRPSKKLAEKYLGPFEIIAQVGSVSFILHLPNSMKSIHPVFHISKLEPSTLNQFPNRIQIPEPPIIINSDSKYKISEILNSCIDKRRKCKLLYLVKWAGYKGTDEETSWLPASKLGHASEVISDFTTPIPLSLGHCHLLSLDVFTPTNSERNLIFL